MHNKVVIYVAIAIEHVIAVYIKNYNFVLSIVAKRQASYYA